MKKLTFCLFSANDNDDEQCRLTLCLDSLLSQDTDESQVILLDCSVIQPFSVPQHSDLKVIRHPMGDKQEWNRSVARNEVSKYVDTPIICHVNGDCFYSPAFARKVIEKMGDGNKLICCQRQDTTQAQWNIIKLLGSNAESLRQGFNKAVPNPLQCPVIHPPAAGECQAMTLEQFKEYGGFYRLMKEGNKLDWKHTAGCDDCNLTLYVRRASGFEKAKHTIEEFWFAPNKPGFLQDNQWVNDPEVYLIHLWHEVRKNRVYWEQNKTDQWTKKDVDYLQVGL